jgi:hypothetical protein
MATTTSSNNQVETSILQFEFDGKVYPGVTIIDSENIKLIWDEEDKSAVIGFQITIKESTEQKITDATEQTAPRLTNILGSITGDAITYKPPVIKIIRNGQTFTRVSKTFRSRWLRSISIENIDISKLSSLLNNYSKLYMQLGHAHNGHRAFLNKDYTQAIREFFFIFEKTGSPEDIKYRSLRHAVSHVRLDDLKTLNELKTNFGIIMQPGQELDVNNPEIKEILYKHTREFRHSVGLYMQEQLKNELAK